MASTDEYVRVEIDGADGIDEVVLGFRREGELYELTAMEPPMEAEITKR
jgi:hypothetical protein